MSHVGHNRHNRPFLSVDPMHREDGFGRVDADAFVLGQGWRKLCCSQPQFGHAMPWCRPPPTASRRAR